MISEDVDAQQSSKVSCATNQQDLLAVAKIVGAFGVLGWVKLHCLSDDEAKDWLELDPWLIVDRQQKEKNYHLAEYKWHSGNLIAKLHGIENRNQAEELKSAVVFQPKSLLPPPHEGQYYWSDLIGLTVINISEQTLGQVIALLETGSKDVLQIKDAEGHIRLLPFIEHYIKVVDLPAKKIVVDWQLDW